MNKKINWEAASNIAIVKYWGKRAHQLPINPSLSFTLSTCKTKTSIDWEQRSELDHLAFEFFYDGQRKPRFEYKLKSFFSQLETLYPEFKSVYLNIDSINSFPHSAGIASSASSMAALSLCMMTIQNEIKGVVMPQEEFLNKASYLARLGSGSACRSVYPIAAAWGESLNLPGSSDEYAIPMADSIHEDFKSIQDYIFIVSRAEKKVSSSAGHQLMERHPYREARIQQAQDHFNKLVPVLKTGDWTGFSKICETEALSLHGLMMSSYPSYILLEPESIHIINEIKLFQQESKLPITFTIDAGPNIHLLFPQRIQEEVDSWIQQSLSKYWDEEQIIFDDLGIDSKPGV